MSDSEIKIYQYLRGKTWGEFDDEHLSDVQIAAIMANMMCEGYCDPTSIEAISTERGTIGPQKQAAIAANFDLSVYAPTYYAKWKYRYAGLGICGWTSKDIKDNHLLKYAEAKHRNWYDLELQLDLFWMEFCPFAVAEEGINQVLPYNDWVNFKECIDVNKATELVRNKYEHPGTEPAELERRQNFAREYLRKFQIDHYVSKTGISYVDWAISIASDDSHGYCQRHRTGDPDYDCSSFVYYALLVNGAINPKTPIWTTGSMGGYLIDNGYTQHAYDPNILEAGDIVVSPHNHTEIYIGDGKFVGCHNDAGGGIYGCDTDPSGRVGQGHGDQNGNEISIGTDPGKMKFIYRKG